MNRLTTRLVVLGAALSVPAALIVAVQASAAPTGVTATFTKTQDWGSGYEATYTITNNTASAISSWKLSFDLGSGQQMGSYWDALESSSASPVTFTNRDYNGTVAANGGTQSFGFIVDYTGTFTAPANCLINGASCAGGPASTGSTGSTGGGATGGGSGTAGRGSGTSGTGGGSGSSGTTSGGTTGATGTGGGATGSTGSGGSGGGGDFAVAPYVDMSNNQEPMLDQAAKAGLKAFTAAFVSGSGCTPIWGDTLPVTDDPTMTALITKAESEGASPIVSFGGEAGIELAQSCTNLSQLEAAYQSVISTLHVTHLDFDIEGAAIADTASNELRDEALKDLEAKNPGLVVSFTIPTFPTGPDFNGDAFLKQAVASGLKIGVVNVMAMDYGGSFDTPGANRGTQAIDAAQGTLAFLKTILPGATYGMVGVTPMIGVNDDSAETFTTADAQALVTFARQNHLGRLAFWSVDRDQPCGGSVSGLPSCSEVSQSPLAFTRIFDQFTG